MEPGPSLKNHRHLLIKGQQQQRGASGKSKPRRRAIRPKSDQAVSAPAKPPADANTKAILVAWIDQPAGDQPQPERVTVAVISKR